MKLNIRSRRMPSIISATKFSFFVGATFLIVSAQSGFAQDSSSQTLSQSQLSQLLSSYYKIKDALIDGQANLASASAEQFVKITNGIDYKVISEGNINALLKDAGKISVTNDIQQQRVSFANLSLNMFLLAKAITLTPQPVYEMYCPMKKAYWLSSEKTIRNPYFGNTMLTCGSVVKTVP